MKMRATIKRCPRCKSVPVVKLWICRSCGARCCAHLCSLKVGTEASCGSCRMKTTLAWRRPGHRPEGEKP